MPPPPVSQEDHHPYDLIVNCCNTPEPTDQELKELQYWSTVKDVTKELFDKVASEQIFGKVKGYTCTLKLYHRLALYLNIIYEHRYNDAMLDSNNEDQGNAYYREYYCIDTIKKQLLCKGISSSILRSIFDIYSLNSDNDTSSDDGIGDGSIEGPDPYFVVN